MTSSASSYPYDTVVRITDRIGAQEWQGSGVLISPNEVLTASHVVYMQGVGTATNITVTPGYSDGSSPYGSASGASFNYFPVDDANDLISNQQSQSDYAVIHLSTPFEDIGTMGIEANFAGGSANITGYPASASGAQVTSSQSVTVNPNYTLLDGTSIGDGSSGGPVWIETSDGPEVVGLVSSSASDGTGYNVQITTSVLDQIEAWVAEDDASGTGGAGASPAPLTPPNFFNSDDKADILWQNTDGDVALWNSTSGSGGFTSEDLGVVGGSWQIAGTGAFNGASEAGLLWRNANGDTELWNPNGSGGFVGEDLGVVGTSWQVAGTGDFTGSGEGILWQNSNGDAELWNASGPGGFVGEDLGVVPSSWQIAGTGDFTGKGEDGILWRNANGDTELWNPNGSGGFTGEDLGVVGGGWQIAGTGDFSGKGQDSILWRNTNSGTELWNPNGSGGFVREDLGVVPSSWQIAGTGDFSGNGQSGILWRNTNGDTTLWNPNGSGGFTNEDLGVVPTSWSVHKIFA